jgi:hypothetical protein
MVTAPTRKLSERVAGMTRALESRTGGFKAFHGSGFAIATILLESISTHLFVQTLRSVIVAPAIFEKLVPILIGLIAAPVVVVLLTLVCNDLFLGLAGAFVQALGRGFLILPSDPLNVVYYLGMICSVFGYLMVFLGVLGAALKRTQLNDIPEPVKHLPEAIASGVMLGMAMNIALRLPNPAGISLAENVLCNTLLLFALSFVALYWYAEHRREHNVLKDALPADAKRGNEKRFRKTLHLFMLGPCFAVLGFYFNRPEWIAAASGIPYTATAFILVLSILAVPLVRSLGVLKEQMVETIALVCVTASFVGIGFMHYLPVGPYVLLLVVPAPFGLGIVLDRAIGASALERADNIDVTIILAWMVALCGILGSNVLGLLVFVPYAGIIIMAPLLAYVAINALVARKRGKGVAA